MEEKLNTAEYITFPKTGVRIHLPKERLLKGVVMPLMDTGEIGYHTGFLMGLAGYLPRTEEEVEALHARAESRRLLKRPFFWERRTAFVIIR